MKRQEKNTPKRAMVKLLILGCAFVPLAYFSDCVLDALLFEGDSLWEQLISPTAHEISIRFVFSTFILGVTWFGCHLIRQLDSKYKNLVQKCGLLQKENQDLEMVARAIVIDVRGRVVSVATKVSLLDELQDKMDKETIFSTVREVEGDLYKVENTLDDLYLLIKP